MPKTYTVAKIDNSYFVLGLNVRTYELSEGRSYTTPGTGLLMRHEEGDVSNPSTRDMMHSALYDLYQCCEVLEAIRKVEQEIIFLTPHGCFRTDGVHVVPVDETKAEAKSRRAKCRRAAKNVR